VDNANYVSAIDTITVIVDSGPPALNAGTFTKATNWTLSLTFSSFGCGFKPNTLEYWGNTTGTNSPQDNHYTNQAFTNTATTLSATISNTNVSASDTYFCFKLTDNAGLSNTYYFSGGPSSFAKKLGIGTGSVISSLSGTRSSANFSSRSSLPVVPISFVDTASGFTSPVKPTLTEQAKDSGSAIDVSYASQVSSKPSSIDSSGLSLLQRTGRTATKAATATQVPATQVRFAGTPASTAAPSRTTGSAGESAAGSGAPSVPQAPASSLQARGGASASAAEPQPLPKGPSAPSGAPASGVDLYVNQSASRREESLEPCDDGEERDIL
jgi:hypothetical protein